MVLRYKILTACVILLFAFVWLNRIDFFPLSSNGMYADAVGGGGINYFDLRDSSGALVDDNVAFYVAPTTSGNPRVLSSGKRRSSSKLCWIFLPKPIPGSSQICPRNTP